MLGEPWFGPTNILLHLRLNGDFWLPAQISLDPLFGWYAALPLALILLASLWLTLSMQGVSRSRKSVLVALRLLAMLILFLGWLRPGFISTQQRESAGAVAILLDRSASMTLPSGDSTANRWQVQADVWQQIVSLTDLKIGETQIVPYFFDSSVVPASSDDLPKLEQAFSTKPNGKLTDLGGALGEVAKQQLEPPLRGVIVMGDAAQTKLPPDMDATVIARQMAQLDQPVLMVGIGSRGEASLLKDVALEGVPEQFSAFVKKELKVPVVVSALGIQSTPIEVTLTLRASGRADQVVGSRKLVATKPSEKIPLEFRIELPDEGEYLLETSAKVDASEQIISNNKSLSFVTVRDGGVRILMLDGQLRYEQAYLRRSLGESVDFEVEALYVPEKERLNWPDRRLDREVNFAEYDAIVIGDLDARAISPAAATAIRRRVESGGGLLLLGGYHSYSAGGYNATALRGLVPFEMNDAVQAWGRTIDPRQHVLGDIKLQPTRPNSITSLARDPIENRRLWESLKPLDGMNRFGAIKNQLGTQVLLESGDGDPVLVAAEAGRGRVLAFAGDTTWRWWTGGRKRLHQQFWRQCLLWLIRRDTLNEGFRLELDRRRLAIDETPDLGIEWFGGSENKEIPQSVRLELSRDGRPLQTLSPQSTSETTKQVQLTGLDKPGLYRVQLKADGPAGETYETEVAFVVREESLELEQPAADWQMMDNIVAANKLAGGRLLLPEEIGEAIQWLRDRQEATKVTTIEKRRLGDAAWDAWVYLALFCIFMSIEWGLRKSWQLP